MTNQKSALQIDDERERQAFIEQTVKQVTADFERRQKERLPFERQWELNLNFLRGNQYCSIDKRGEVSEDDKEFFWQSREVYNHIATIVETRLAKFARVTPSISVMPKSDDDQDVLRATLAEKLVAEAFKKTQLDKIVRTVTAWAEACGTAFYKIIWDNQGGNLVGQVDDLPVYEGEINILPVSPFEIFPDTVYAQKIEDCKSVIHAKALSVSEIFEKYGVKVQGEEVDAFTLSNVSGGYAGEKVKRKLSDSAVVIERYELPSKQFPRGRLITVAGGKLLYYGDLPYLNGANSQRGFPFVRQICVPVSGSFYGASIIERLIPVQRAFNAVKNRKHEFLNRLSMGVMTVEDGSVDTDDLSVEGLPPGKILVYRQGAKAPEIMEKTSLPPDFKDEENNLLNEFVIISGVSDVASSKENATVTSGTALEILIEQDNERLTMYAEEIRNCYLEVSKHVLRLYSQFITDIKAIKYLDAFGKTKLIYADQKVASCDDVYLESENELMQTASQKKRFNFQVI